MHHAAKSAGDGRRHMAAGVLVLILTLALLGFALLPAAAAGKVVRVGFVDTSGALTEEDGVYTGYIVDYLEELARYTGWSYEYLPGTLAENMDKLAAGQLDLLCMMRHTQEREEEYLFSYLSMAHDYTAVRAAAGSGYYYADHQSFDGARVGVMAKSIHEQAFLKQMDLYGVQCEMVPFDLEQEMVDALLDGSVELIATDGLSNYPDTKLVDRFQMERTYFITGLGNQGLMDELNSALEQVRIENPALEDTLLQKHFSQRIGSGLLLTREETEYLASAGTIVVMGFDGRRPLGYETQAGEFVGVLADCLDMLGSRSGLKFVHEKSSTMSLEESAAIMSQQGCAMLFIDQDLAALGLEDELYKSDPLLHTGLAYVKRAGGGKECRVFAVNSEMGYVGDMLLAYDPTFTVKYYDATTACMEAVISGQADMTIQDEHVVTYLLQKPRYADKLTQVEGGEKVDAMCLYAPPEHRHLVGIINKTLDRLGEEQLTDFVSHAMISHSYEYRLEDMLYEYGWWIAAFALLLLVIILLVVVVYTRAVKFRDEKARAEELQKKIQLDPLTGVYSREFFFEKAREIIDGGGDDLYIARFNVCNFKLINELYGSEKGDQLLREMGHDLTELGRQVGFIVGRFTGDHFYLCVRRDSFESLPLPHQAPAAWLGMDITMTYGVYPVGQQKDLPISIMCDRADIAIAARGHATAEHIFYYSDEIRQRMLREQELESEMEPALVQRQFCIHIQPKYDVETEAIVGGEALVRWIHPTKGMVSPGEFIPLFERNGFIRKLDYFVWEECCAFLRGAKDQGLRAPPVSINVSRVHFYGSELQSTLERLLKKYRLQAGDVQLEVTETICGEDPDVIFEKCRSLRAAGFQIAMDDFGSGYSSLNMLKEMPLDILKMDLRFLSAGEEAQQREKGRSILYSLIHMAHELKLQVVVEGVETKEQEDFIRQIGGCSAQGYYFSRPITPEDFAALLKEKGGA